MKFVFRDGEVIQRTWEHKPRSKSWGEEARQGARERALKQSKNNSYGSFKEAFIKAFNSLIENKEKIITGYEVILKELLDTTKLEKKAATIQNEIEVLEELFRKIVDENPRKAMDQKEYTKKYNELVERYKKGQDELNEVEEKQQENKVRKDSIDTFIDRLKSQDIILTDFDGALWTSTINKVVIENDIIFYFKDGTKIKQEIL
ncbi:hypothetical protein [Clostridium sp. Cult1]|uniref:hypothetical protein n=1 Tax=Clostridium sp. Cult1 TaxID=2079002 RepID=UPI001F27A5DA|nr:hypothetical protein [Clostridium sp. Cult1]